MRWATQSRTSHHINMSLNTLKYAIIGAGPAGLTLACLLQNSGFSCTVYESEKSRDARGQGGSLDLHVETGQLALRKAGLWDEFTQYMRAESDVYKLFDSTGQAYFDENAAGNRRGKNRPEIDRRQLRDLLLDSLTPGSISWGRKLRSVEASASKLGSWDLHFEDGSIERGFNLVVGADGAWSKVRPLLTQEKPFYCGITAVVGTLNDIPNRHPKISALIGAGSCLACDDQRTISAQIQSGGAAVTYAQLRVSEMWSKECGIDWTSPMAGQQLIEEHFLGWKQEFKDFILKTDEPLVARPLYMLPIGAEWVHKPGLTLIGDAAHLMSPFGGVGVNVAMEDALKLWQAIVSLKDGVLDSDASVSRNTLSEAIKGYEVEMFPRAKKNAELSKAGLEIRFGKNAAPVIQNLFKRLSSSDEEIQVGGTPSSKFHYVVTTHAAHTEESNSQ